MNKHDFGALYEKYPHVIAQMPDTFDGHEFVLKLAHQNQVLYIEALYSYRDSPGPAAPAPFMPVHRILGRRLEAHPDLVRRLGDVTSKNIFGEEKKCALWKKV